MAVGWRYIFQHYHADLEFFERANLGTVWSILTLCVGMLVSFRANRAYSRFWEGVTLVQLLRSEWFEAASNIMAFSKVAVTNNPEKFELHEKVADFQAILVRLMSPMHGAAMRQIGGNVEEFEVIDVFGLDDESLKFVGLCEARHVNIVEILIHWIQVLITDNIHTGVMCIAPPILTRAYQTLSRGMVNLHDARKIADVPFPFPLSQLHVVLVWVQCIVA